MPDVTIAPEVLYNFTVIDVLKEQVGTVDRVWVGEDEETPQFYGVKTGGFRHRTHVIPADNVRIDFPDRAIWVPYRTEQVKDGPTFDGDADLTEEIKREVFEYYSRVDPSHRDPERDMEEHLG